MAHISHQDPRISLPKKLLGRTRALALGYSNEQLDRYASISQQDFSGAGNPFLIRTIKKGEVVVDIGCGTGTDACIASGMVGSSGQVFGIESNSNSLSTARQQARLSRLRNITFTKAYAEKLPLPNACADVVISNGTLSQCANKVKVITEIFRVLKPGGRVQIVDILISPDLKEASNPRKFTDEQYLAALRKAGFESCQFDLHQLDPGAQSIAHPDPVLELSSVQIYARKPVSTGSTTL